MHKVEFYYDVVSPYSWFAFETFCRLKTSWNIDLDLCPFFLGGVMHATGNRAPAHFVAKAPYLLQDLQRQSAYFGTPLCIPETFPANTITAMRLLTVVKQKSPQALESLSRALWQLHYGEGQDITTEPNLLLAATRAGLTANAAIQFLQQTQDADIKETLKTVTAKAVEMGAFGAPTFFIETPQGNEMFFGSDRFHLVASMLGKQWLGPLP